MECRSQIERYRKHFSCYQVISGKCERRSNEPHCAFCVCGWKLRIVIILIVAVLLSLLLLDELVWNFNWKIEIRSEFVLFVSPFPHKSILVIFDIFRISFRSPNDIYETVDTLFFLWCCCCGWMHSIDGRTKKNTEKKVIQVFYKQYMTSSARCSAT